MYDRSRLPSSTNVLTGPCDSHFSRWSLSTPTTAKTVIHPSASVAQSTAMFSSSSSFCFPQPPTPPRAKQTRSPIYVNIHPVIQSSSSAIHLSNSERPRSSMFAESTTTSSSSSIAHLNDLRQRYEAKGVVGIVKPMVHQRSLAQLNNDENKLPEMIIRTKHRNSTRSLYPSSTSPVMYRSRRLPSHGHSNGQPPAVPRRHSSISNHKYSSSHRSSRTTSTSSSTAPTNELSSTLSSPEDEQDETRILDVKRLEMFYSSVGTVVKSARSSARLYITTTRQLAGFEDWSCQQRGVPLWIYNTGANLKRTRQVRLLLAQYDSCFAVWSTLVSNQAELRLPKEHYITCWLPESNLLAILKFEREDACRLFFRNYYEILEHERRMAVTHPPPLPAAPPPPNPVEGKSKPPSNAKEIPRRYSRLRTLGNKQNKEEDFELRRCRSLSKIRTVKKSAISGPINFEHVNHLSSGCHQERPLSSSGTLRSLHASMSQLPSHSSFPADRSSNSNKKRTSTAFEARTTAV